MDLHDEPDDEGQRQKAVVAMSIVQFLQAVSTLCGEHFLTHEEHQELTHIADMAGKRWLENRETLNRLDFDV